MLIVTGVSASGVPSESASTRSRAGSPSRRASAAETSSLPTTCDAAENVTGR